MQYNKITFECDVSVTIIVRVQKCDYLLVFNCQYLNVLEYMLSKIYLLGMNGQVQPSRERLGKFDLNI